MVITRLLSVAGAAAGLLAAGAARADVIDGSWCSEDGHRMQIEGPQIVTPAGTRTQGQYARHYFSYKVPESEQGAGQAVSMVLVNENTVQLTIGGGPMSSGGVVQIWHRCVPPVS